jgi:hypothetical protein
MAAEHCPIVRSKPQPRTVNVRPYLDEFWFSDANLEMSFWVTHNGTARPDEVLGMLGVADLLVAGDVLERTRLELHDENTLTPGTGVPVPALGPSQLEGDT